MQVPWPSGASAAVIQPPCRSTIRRQTESPIPCPSYAERVGARWKGSKTASRSAGLMPMPRSATLTSTQRPS